MTSAACHSTKQSFTHTAMYYNIRSDMQKDAMARMTIIGEIKIILEHSLLT